MRQADLHMHSTFSDGLLTPQQLAQKCAAQGLDVCVLTDHDTLGGFAEFQSACDELGMQTFTGIELSTTFHGASFHVLGYGVDRENPQLRAHLHQTIVNRRNRLLQILEELKVLGIALDQDAVMNDDATRVGRPKIADMLVSGGYVGNFKEAFEKYLGTHGKAYVPYEKIQADAAVQLIKASGGQAVLAHPGLQNRDDLISELVAAGLDGLEVIHPEHSPELVIHYEQMATQYKLYTTGGSDYHARTFDEEYLGKFSVPERRIKPLLEMLYD
ncbi:MAG: PHP domain-containing protein [Lentisphaeria bacterium]|nr:PHP domain-containing protein [Candidatus Neomarinimicrobiota bacterium]MCF7841552.1 PHP domain-containing protein [Lentisphaeria bacterium]